MIDETLSKAELALIDKIVGAFGMRTFKDLLWSKVSQAFGFTFHNTQVKYGFTHATPDPLALKYLEERVFILSDKTRDRLTGNLRWELLEGIRNTESISDIKKRLEPIFTKMHDYEIERIARTETLNAMNAGRLEAYEASEVTHYKMWRAAINNKRTAADSRRLHGQIQELSDPFVDPKTGDAVMHPPNRPNCRCTMIPLRKLPENIVRKGGQMYASDEMVGKIEIDISLLQKGEKRVWVKATAKRKGHYRKVRCAKKVEPISRDLVDMAIARLEDHPEIIKEIRDTHLLVKSGKTSKSENLASDGDYTDDRKVLHGKIIKGVFGIAKPSENPEVIFVGGGPCSGKGTLVGKIQNLDNYVYLNNDEIKKKLPGYAGTKSAYYHEESREICYKMRSRAKELGLNIVLDTTMRDFDKSMKVIADFKSDGYRTKLLSANLPLEKALARAVHRTIGGEKRFVPLKFISEVMDETNKNQFKYLKYVDSGQVFNTDVERGADFILMGGK